MDEISSQKSNGSSSSRCPSRSSTLQTPTPVFVEHDHGYTGIMGPPRTTMVPLSASAKKRRRALLRHARGTHGAPQVHSPAKSTRSKQSLQHIPIEQLEATLRDPDISINDYDFHANRTDDDDYLEFLAELQRTEAGSVDDDESDTDYNFMDDEEDSFSEDEYRLDRATKVPSQFEIKIFFQIIFNFQFFFFRT